MNEQDAAVGVSMDTSGAEEQLKKLQQAAESLDATLEKLQASATRVGNSLKLPNPDTGKPTTFDDYDDMEGHFSNLSREQMFSLKPRLGQLMTEVDDRRATIASSVSAFAQAKPDALVTATGPTLYKQYTQFQQNPYPTPPPPPPLLTPATPAPPNPPPATATTATTTQNVPSTPLATQSAPITMMGGGGVTPTTPLVYGPSPSEEEAPQDDRPTPRFPWSPPAYGPFLMGNGLRVTPGTTDDTGNPPTDEGANRAATGDADTQDSRLADHIASAMQRSGGRMAASMTRGVFDAAGMPATGEIASSVARPLAGAIGDMLPIAGPILGILGGLAAVAGIGVEVATKRAEYAGQEQQLTGAVGTAPGLDNLSTARNAGWRFDFFAKDSVAAAEQLGQAGVGAHEMGGDLAASMALARVGGVGLSEATDVTGNLAKSGMSSREIASYFADLDAASQQSGVSVQRLVGSIKTLQQQAGIGAVNINGLASAQAQYGRVGDVGQAVAGGIGAHGFDAVVDAQILGVSQQQFAQAQKDPAALLDLYSRLAKRFDVGPLGHQVAEDMMQRAGFSFAGLTGPQTDAKVDAMAHAPDGAAVRREAAIAARERQVGGDVSTRAAAFMDKGQHAADAVTSPADRAGIMVEQGAYNVIHGVAHAPAPRDTRFGPGGVDLSQGPNPARIQPTRPIGDTETSLLTTPLALPPLDSQHNLPFNFQTSTPARSQASTDRAARELHLPPMTWHQAMENPQVRDRMAADQASDAGAALAAGRHAPWAHALATALSPTSSGGDMQTVSLAQAPAATTLTQQNHTLDIQVTVNDPSGRVVGQARTTHSVHSVQTDRAPKGQQTHLAPTPVAKPGIPRVLDAGGWN